ncbi:hypothetical protein K503DRAFT_773595 [Rhizopogon vinicolor AM-OR11-026]|uniref:Uncharacterized protein n=1 Tax=Rhizopogon vinicolor AM-OR11-026 TaxID=1314800 RepID=A0A1B7MRT4_9AGAM|nr:hypothetical protein K503DRAFT_773595 [Rhizopogon vinicolor AM-OR11-026]
MKFTMIISTAVLAGIATATNPNGGPCAHAEQFECGVLEGYNNGNPFAFWCASDNKIVVARLCDCPSCCTLIDDFKSYTCL